MPLFPRGVRQELVRSGFDLATLKHKTYRSAYFHSLWVHSRQSPVRKSALRSELYSDSRPPAQSGETQRQRETRLNENIDKSRRDINKVLEEHEIACFIELMRP